LFGMIYLSSCIEYKLVRLFGKVYGNNLWRSISCFFS
jgi:hypothetical protein